MFDFTRKPSRRAVLSMPEFRDALRLVRSFRDRTASAVVAGGPGGAVILRGDRLNSPYRSRQTVEWERIWLGPAAPTLGLLDAADGPQALIMVGLPEADERVENALCWAANVLAQRHGFAPGDFEAIEVPMEVGERVKDHPLVQILCEVVGFYHLSHRNFRLWLLRPQTEWCDCGRPVWVGRRDGPAGPCRCSQGGEQQHEEEVA